MEVELLQWPEEDARRERLRLAGAPRLLLVGDDGEPPLTMDCLEDWTRDTAPDSEMRVRIESLAVRRRAHASGQTAGSPLVASPGRSLPNIDADGVLRYDGAWAALPPLEARITEALLERFGAVAGREALLRAGWARDTPSRNALDVHVLRLRRRVGPLGLAIRTIRSRGYLMEAVSPAPACSRSDSDGDRAGPGRAAGADIPATRQTNELSYATP